MYPTTLTNRILHRRDLGLLPRLSFRFNSYNFWRCLCSKLHWKIHLTSTRLIWHKLALRKMSSSPRAPPPPDEGPKEEIDGEDDYGLTGDLPVEKKRPPLLLDSAMSAESEVDFGAAVEERQDPDAVPSLSSSEEVKVPQASLSIAPGGSPDSPVADHTSVEAKAKFERAAKEAKTKFERGAKHGNINDALDFAATVLTHASNRGVLHLLDCLVFALKLPTLQAGFNLLSIGAFCMVSAIKAAVGKEESSWRVNFPGQDAGESATGIVDGKPVLLKYVSGTWELRYVLTPLNPPPPASLS